MENRRTFLKSIALWPVISSFEEKVGREESYLEFPRIGTVRIKKPTEIESSPFGIGCETLDRALWDPKEVYPWMNDLPVKWARLQTGWARVEKEKGKYDWEWLDESVDGLIDRGFKPFFNVGYGNLHYTEGDMGYHPLLTDHALKGWKNFVVALAQRYKNKITHYEIWNEPNLAGFWKPDRVNPSNYVRLVKETAPLIRQNAPNSVIVGGVTSRIPYNFIKPLFEEGLGQLIDIFSFHPYGTIPERYNERIIALKKLAQSYNPRIKLWQGENGFPSEPNSTGFSGEGPWTENIQAKIMLRRLINDLAFDIPMSLWFLIVDLHDYPKGSGKVNYKGILKTQPKIAPKIAFKSLQYLGSLIHGNVRTANTMIHLIDGKKPMDEPLYDRVGNGLEGRLPNTLATTLQTANGLVLAYWSTSKAQDLPLNQITSLFLWDWEGSGFQEPVLVDPLQGTIHEIPKPIRFYDNDKYRISQEAQGFPQLPLQDYPLLIMEKSKVI